MLGRILKLYGSPQPSGFDLPRSAQTARSLHVIVFRPESHPLSTEIDGLDQRAASHFGVGRTELHVMLNEGRRSLTQARLAMRTARAATAPHVTVGFYGSAASDLLPAALRVFGEREPSVAISTRELPFGDIEAIVSGEVSIAFTRLTPGRPSRG